MSEFRRAILNELASWMNETTREMKDLEADRKRLLDLCDKIKNRHPEISDQVDSFKDAVWDCDDKDELRCLYYKFRDMIVNER